MFVNAGLSETVAVVDSLAVQELEIVTLAVLAPVDVMLSELVAEGVWLSLGVIMTEPDRLDELEDTTVADTEKLLVREAMAVVEAELAGEPVATTVALSELELDAVVLGELDRESDVLCD